MEQVQVQKLKINAINLKNSLTGYNKKLIKLRREEVRFSFTQEKQKIVLQKEKKLESKGFFQNLTENIKSRIVSIPMSFFDKVKEFFSIIFLGLIVNNLPAIIGKIEKFFAENKLFLNAIKITVKLIGDGIMGTIWLITEYPKLVQKSMMNELEWSKKELDRVGDILDSAYKVWSNFYNPSPSSTPATLSPPPSQRSQGTYPPQQSRSSNPNGSPPQPVQNRSKGGTIKGESKSRKDSTNTSPSPTKKTVSTPLGRKAIESVDAFETFATVSNQFKEQSVLLDGRGGVNENFNKVNESFDQFLIALGKKDKTPTPPGRPSGSPGSSGPPAGSSIPSIPGNGKISGGAIVTQRNDPDGEQTGIDIALKDSSGGYGIGALIKNPFESLKITGTGFQGSGSGESGSGFGLYVTGEAVVDGKRYELLVGHLDKKYVKRGDVISGGDSIGAQGISGRATGPHVSTHINALDGGNPQSVLNAVERSWINGTLIKSQNMKPGSGGVTPLVSNKKIGQSPDESLMAMNAVDFFVTQVIEKPVPFPMPMPIRVNSNNSSNDFFPEISPLLLT